jgi:hypothetical protein
MSVSLVGRRSSRAPVARRSTALRLVAVVAAVAVVLAAGMYFYDHSRRDLIANGVRIAGVSVGGMR